MKLKDISIEDRNICWAVGVAGFYFAALNICLYDFRDKDKDDQEIDYQMNEIDPEDSVSSRKDLPVLKYRHG